MKKIIITVGLVLAMLAIVSFSHAGSTSLELYYQDCITKKIDQCERLAAMVNSKSECIRRCAKMRRLQARFLRMHRDELIGAMIAENVQMKAYKVDYFLTKAFFNAHPQLSRR